MSAFLDKHKKIFTANPQRGHLQNYFNCYLLLLILHSRLSLQCQWSQEGAVGGVLFWSLPPLFPLPIVAKTLFGGVGGGFSGSLFMLVVVLCRCRAPENGTGHFWGPLAPLGSFCLSDMVFLGGMFHREPTPCRPLAPRPWSEGVFSWHVSFCVALRLFPTCTLLALLAFIVVLCGLWLSFSIHSDGRRRLGDGVVAATGKRLPSSGAFGKVFCNCFQILKSSRGALSRMAYFPASPPLPPSESPVISWL